jgi:GH24 family phage-related lysozyme (muramidase)
MLSDNFFKIVEVLPELRLVLTHRYTNLDELFAPVENQLEQYTGQLYFDFSFSNTDPARYFRTVVVSGIILRKECRIVKSVPSKVRMASQIYYEYSVPDLVTESETLTDNEKFSILGFSYLEKLSPQRQLAVVGYTVSPENKQYMLEQAVKLIKEFEGFSSVVYVDPRTGGKPLTIGYGSTQKPDGSEWKKGDTITEAGATALLTHQLATKYVPGLEKIPCWQTLNINQQAALLSFAYNLGANFYGSTGFDTISRCLREQDFSNIEKVFLMYCNPGSKVEAGLKKRRLAEARLFLTPIS